MNSGVMNKNMFCEVTVTFTVNICAKFEDNPCEALQRHHVHKSGMSVRARGQPKNIMPPASAAAGETPNIKSIISVWIQHIESVWNHSYLLWPSGWLGWLVLESPASLPQRNDVIPTDHSDSFICFLSRVWSDQLKQLSADCMTACF